MVGVEVGVEVGDEVRVEVGVEVGVEGTVGIGGRGWGWELKVGS